MTDLWQYLKKADKPVYLYGMGNGADKILDTLDALNVKASGVFVSDGFVRDKIFRGFKLKSYSQVCDQTDDFIVLVSFGTSLTVVSRLLCPYSIEDKTFRLIGETILHSQEQPESCTELYKEKRDEGD